MNPVRQLQRNYLRKKVGNKNLRKAWRKVMIKKNGAVGFLMEYNRTTGKHLAIDEIYL